jgi:hypothetical protein
MNNVFQFNIGYSILAILVIAFIFLASKWNRSEKKPEKVYPRQPQFGDEEIEVILRKRHFTYSKFESKKCPISIALGELFPGSLSEIFILTAYIPINSSNKYLLSLKDNGQPTDMYTGTMYINDLCLAKDFNLDDDSIIRTIKLIKQK